MSSKTAESHPKVDTSLLENLFGLIEAQSNLKLFFEDTSGITFEIPDFLLSEIHRVFTCKDCSPGKTSFEQVQITYPEKHYSDAFTMKQIKDSACKCLSSKFDLVEPLYHKGFCLGFFCAELMLQSDNSQTVTRAEVSSEQAIQLSPSDEISSGRRWIDFILMFSKRLLQHWDPSISKCLNQQDATINERSSAMPTIIINAVRYVHQNFSEELGVNTIASKLRCHPVYLGRIFKNCMKRNLSDYICDVRISEARELLESKELSVGEIAYQVGFQDQSYFGKQFKKRFNESPGAYQKRIAQAKVFFF